MEVNTITALVMSAPLSYTAVSQASTGTALVIADCEDTLNALGTLGETAQRKPKPRQARTED